MILLPGCEVRRVPNKLLIGQLSTLYKKYLLDVSLENYLRKLKLSCDQGQIESCKTRKKIILGKIQEIQLCGSAVNFLSYFEVLKPLIHKREDLFLLKGDNTELEGSGVELLGLAKTLILLSKL
eukprot:GHVP01057339.1.p2 GENE.GHVP01057339.1~~GHVP01057339.1.p2  ORF type:complete len:124 (+),score=12.16 GHVP01057339.1:936-1307(+)